VLQNATLLGVSMEPRKNRRLLVTATYSVVLMVLTAIVIVAWAYSGYLAFVLSLVYGAILTLTFQFFGRIVKQTLFSELRMGEFIFLGLGRKRRGTAEPDERDLAVRNAASFTAYRILAIYSFFVFLMLFPAFDSGNRLAFLLLVLPYMLFAPTLPQAVILWTEPDVPEENGNFGQALKV
jgi:hypothetical protein